MRCLADIYEEVSGSIRGLGLDTECLGGGRIEHYPDNKKIKVYGHSTVKSQINSYIFYIHDLMPCIPRDMVKPIIPNLDVCC